MEQKRVTDEQIVNQVGGIIDTLAEAGKKAVRQFFDLMVERTVDTANNLTDKGVDKLKQKIDETGSHDKTTKD